MINTIGARKNPACFNCFDVGNSSNFAMVNSLRRFIGCQVDTNTFLFWK